MSSEHPYSAAEFWQEAEALGRAAQVSLEYLQAMGLEALDIALASPSPAAPKPLPRQAGPKAAAPPPPRPQGEKVAACQGCLLGRERPAPPLTGRGSPKPVIVFVAESPAVFEGEAAKLLAAMIENGLKLAPDDFYITSLLKCPVDEGDFPEAAAARCLPGLERELSRLKPSIVLALGKWPGRFLSGQPGEHLLMLRQKTYALPGLKAWLRVTYSLDELLATPELKKEAWKDLQKLIPVITKLKSA